MALNQTSNIFFDFVGRDAPADKTQPFSEQEDLRLIKEVVRYESSVRNGSKDEKSKFWQELRAIFEQNNFQPRGPAQITRQVHSPYFKRWTHIRVSYNRVKQLVTRSGTVMPQSQRELDQLINEAYERCRSGTQKMAKLHIGFRHFRDIFNALGGFTQCVGIADHESTDASEAESKSEPEQNTECIAQATSPRSVSNKRKRQISEGEHLSTPSRRCERNTQALGDILGNDESSHELANSKDASETALVSMAGINTALNIIHTFHNTLEAIRNATDPQDIQILESMKRFLGEKFQQIFNSS